MLIEEVTKVAHYYVSTVQSGTIVTKMVRPKTSLQLAEVGLALSVVIGCWAVKDVETKWLTYFWGLSIGFFLGWYYPVSNL